MSFSSLLYSFNEYAPLHLVIVTGILTIVTGIYAFYIYHSFRLSQREYELRNRPYFLILKDISLPLAEGGVNFIFKIKNCGKTPAQLISHEFVFLKCNDIDDKFSEPYGRTILKHRFFLPPGEEADFEVRNTSKDKKVGLIIKTKCVGVYFKKVFESKALFKLEGRIVHPIDSSVS